MKPMISYLFLLVMALFVSLIFFHMQEKISPKLLTVSTQHVYLYDPDDFIEFTFFLNVKAHPITDKESYQHIYIMNPDQTRKLELELRHIEIGHQEAYLKETYRAIHLKFRMPYLDGTFEIDDAYVQITLSNQDTYQFKLGQFALLKKESETNHLFWTSIDGVKKENHFVSRLSHIFVAYDELGASIESVELGPHVLVSFVDVDRVLKITILEDSYLFYQTPVIIRYSDGTQQSILNFKYLKDYHILKESGMLINHYALS